MIDANSQRDKTVAIEGGNLTVDQEKLDSHNLLLTPDRNQDPRSMNSRSLDYESVVLNSLSGNFIFYYLIIILLYSVSREKIVTFCAPQMMRLVD